MVYITGDIHGNPTRILDFVDRVQIRETDVIVILGDVGMNYYGGRRDKLAKQFLSAVPCPVLCIHGNHEQRPQGLPAYHEVVWNGGVCYVEDEWPKLLFAKDGEIFELEGKRCLVIGGAYSVDKFYRLAQHFGWWPDEQPSPEIKAYVERQIKEHKIDVILTHTCPYRYIPREAFLPQIDQKTVDSGTELWLDAIEAMVAYEAWYCGHWHTNKRIDKMHFLFDGWSVLGEPQSED